MKVRRRRVQFMVTAGLREPVKAEAAERGLTAAAFVVQTLREGLERIDPAGPRAPELELGLPWPALAGALERALATPLRLDRRYSRTEIRELVDLELPGEADGVWGYDLLRSLLRDLERGLEAPG